VTAEVVVSGRVNPFTPGKRLARPELFSGRTTQLEAGIALLRQTAGGDVRHGLITGDRGIGKALSRASRREWPSERRATSNAFGLSEDDVPFQLLVSEHIAQRSEGVRDIAAGLPQGLKRARGHRARKINVDIQLDLKVVKAAFDGIVLVIDEIDRVADVEGILGNHRPRTEIAPS
jgi:hypothetical protein